MGHISQSGVQVDVDAPKGQDLAQVMDSMRANYEKMALKNVEELKMWHENQVGIRYTYEQTHTHMRAHTHARTDTCTHTHTNSANPVTSGTDQTQHKISCPFTHLRV